MIRQPTDADGLVVPAVDLDAAWDAAERLTSVARTARAAAADLDAAPASALCWSGSAADAYRQARQRLERRTAEVAELAAAGSAIVLGWLQQAVPAVRTMQAVAVRVRALQQQVAAASAAGYDPVLDARLQRDLDTAYREWHAAHESYWHAVHLAARRLVAVRDVVTDRPLDGRDHAREAMDAFWQNVSEPVTAAWAVTGLAALDRDRWWDNVSGLPGDTLDVLTSLVTDPLGAVRSAVDYDDWASGHWGAAAGGTAAMFLPGPKWLGLGEDVGRARFARNLADPHAPLPVVQSLDEMLAGVDLSRHEHHGLGHALRRHVDVDDDYLMDRLTHGTLEDSGTRGHTPQTASRFTDRATAERLVTEAIRFNQLDVHDFLHQPVGTELHLTLHTGEVVGQVMAKVPGGFDVRDGKNVAVALRMSRDGPYVATAFVLP